MIIITIFLNMHALKLFSQKIFLSPQRQSNPVFVAWVFVAQWLERLTGDQKVMGSIPIRDSESFSERTAWERAY